MLRRRLVVCLLYKQRERLLFPPTCLFTYLHVKHVYCVHLEENDKLLLPPLLLLLLSSLFTSSVSLRAVKQALVFFEEPPNRPENVIRDSPPPGPPCPPSQDERVIDIGGHNPFYEGQNMEEHVPSVRTESVCVCVFLMDRAACNASVNVCVFVCFRLKCVYE